VTVIKQKETTIKIRTYLR